ncbi:MAG: phospho-N-acetylmuramoyl-pentapeptide-transferase, partial [Actinobacteria bacterium]|nr:phospho-N-acetylmuramoyl-pentapeptide-transferase [Actinomycetota bacterium]
MNWIFTAVVLGGLISLILTPVFIRFQRTRQIGQKIRTDGPQSHSAKTGTPTMGGIIFIFAAILAYSSVSLIKFYRYSDYSIEGIFIVSVFLLCGIIGFV